jgi:hypothetical protein
MQGTEAMKTNVFSTQHIEIEEASESENSELVYGASGGVGVISSESDVEHPHPDDYHGIEATMQSNVFVNPFIAEIEEDTDSELPPPPPAFENQIPENPPEYHFNVQEYVLQHYGAADPDMPLPPPPPPPPRYDYEELEEGYSESSSSDEERLQEEDPDKKDMLAALEDFGNTQPPAPVEERKRKTKKRRSRPPLEDSSSSSSSGGEDSMMVHQRQLGRHHIGVEVMSGHRHSATHCSEVTMQVQAPEDDGQFFQNPYADDKS